jgi:cell division protein FtsI/penicillin-binding protein 2
MSPAPARPVTEVPRSVPVGVARRTAESVRRLRSNFVFLTLVALFAGLLGRLAWLQVVNGPAYRALAAGGSRVDLAPTRGDVTDRHGRPLAFSRPARIVALDAGQDSEGAWVIADPARFAARVADLLEGHAGERASGAKTTAIEVRGAIREARAAATPRRFVPLAWSVEDARTIALLDEAMREGGGDLRGLIVRPTERRTYPNHEWAAHVLGRAVYATRVVGGEVRHEMEKPLVGGESGVEAALDRELRGEAGTREVRKDGRGRAFAAAFGGASPDRAGLEVALTLDVVVQHACEAALDRLVAAWRPRGAVAIVLDPHTGDVLALACRPAFDPNRDAPTTNLAIQGRYEPGSTFKPFTAAAALALGVVAPGERIEMPAEKTFEFPGTRSRTIHDHAALGEDDGCGDVVRLLAHSSNVGAGVLALRIARFGLETRRVNGMRMLFDALALGEPTGLGLPLEAKSAVPRDFDLRNVALSMGFGQNVAVTPIRLASLFAAFAREDFAPVSPRLVLSVGGEARPTRPPLPSLLGDPALQALVRRGLVGVVEEGTGAETFRGCRYAVAGKTGTAKDESRQTYVSSFVGFAPREAPRVVVLVLADRPLATGERKPSGALVAGPAVKDIVEETLDYLGVEPSR